MTDAPNRTSEIASYLAAVERHLGDLPEPIRTDLMSELDLHLAEVAADLGPGMALRDLLGSPESYARELRETAEVQKEPAAARIRRSLSQTFAPVLTRSKTVADRFAASTGHEDAAELAERLRPGWWVLRGAVVAALFVYWLASAQFGVTGYSYFNSIPGLIFGVAMLLLGVWASIKIGMKAPEWGRRRRRVTAAASIAIVALAALQFSPIMTGAFPTTYVETYYDGGDDYGWVTDVHVYDENGRRLTGVYLFDQNGDPLWIGDPGACDESGWNDPFAQDPEVDEFGQAVESPVEEYEVDTSELGYQYPLCAPGENPAATPTPEEDPTATPAPGEGTRSEDPATQNPDADPTSPLPAEADATATPTGDAPTTK
ncbi:hypothetical protein K3N28_04130 [Glycomyces sp. TRM65418]|uniref:HAAS signaling domain-containing protein n=1 Tax=Glycomyces sp. TRM65418 TaxID=2867006 RepID=UPI001CE6133D|nr:hypothetical protein [Glycomyces sp. TRM65418]MCC3762259.1 hypothetical protein [Glycomyces sp. TRM65418]QZD56316.1 hypothetical protein K3N28_04100 [Glycomyces sp. TRM65418]